ncbi:MAG: hypothetical protein GC147_05460 [Porphyrobacter sp.]|nr:hypothetical protein [Porphyrobacter sp.]
MNRLRFAALLLLPLAATAQAQAIKSEPEMKIFSAAEVEAIAMPDLAYTPDPQIAADFDKYFFFHRDGTDFSTAYADITECDSLASGINFYMGGNDAIMQNAIIQYGAAGAIGGRSAGSWPTPSSAARSVAGSSASTCATACSTRAMTATGWRRTCGRSSTSRKA